MGRFNKIISFGIIASCLAAFSSCSQPEVNPLKDAIVKKVIEVNPGMKTFTVTQINKEFDVTLANELDRRQALFETKSRVESKLAAKYHKKRMPVNERKHLEEQKIAGKIIDAIEEYRTVHSSQLDSIIYHVLSIKGYGEMEDGSVVSNAEMLISISPNLHIFNMVPSKGEGSNVYKGMGVAIPGYREMITQFRTEDKE